MSTTTKRDGKRTAANGAVTGPQHPTAGGARAPVQSRPRRRPGKCVICGKPQVQKFRPFCSGRCADVDLHNWIAGNYRVPTDEAPDESAGETASSEPDDGTSSDT